RRRQDRQHARARGEAGRDADLDRQGQGREPSCCKCRQERIEPGHERQRPAPLPRGAAEHASRPDAIRRWWPRRVPPNSVRLVSRRNERQPSWRLQALIGHTAQRNGGRATIALPPLFSGDELREQVGVDVAAREHDDDVLAPGVDPPRQQRGEPDGATGFDHELQLAIGKSDSRTNLFVGSVDTVCEQLAVDRK
ncbi:hypothetical protein chiPu_0032238, partial [Chiloscyllium punctatum]|nr:hypothetical protein [Chiloscyllium punctatum]